jgi:hypothetical protein
MIRTLLSGALPNPKVDRSPALLLSSADARAVGRNGIQCVRAGRYLDAQRPLPESPLEKVQPSRMVVVGNSVAHEIISLPRLQGEAEKEFLRWSPELAHVLLLRD